MSQIIKLKRGTLAALTAANPVLAAGEAVYITDQAKIKVGDGVLAFNALPFLAVDSVNWGQIQGTLADQTDLQIALDGKEAANANIQSHITASPELHREINDAGTGATDLFSAQKIISDLATKQDVLVSGTSIKTVNAESLLGSGNIDVVSSVSSANADIAVNSANPRAPILTLNAALSGADKIVRLNSEGKLDESVLPALAIIDTFVVASEAAQLELDVQKGDIAIRSDIGKTFINQSGANESIADWQEMVAPGTGVTAVMAGDGMDFTTITASGSVSLGVPSAITGTSANGVSATSHTHELDIDSDDVPEGAANLYYTDARARASVSGGDGVSYNSSTGVISLDVNGTQFNFNAGVLEIAVIDGGEIV